MNSISHFASKAHVNPVLFGPIALLAILMLTAPSLANDAKTVEFGNTDVVETEKRVDPQGRCDPLTLLFYPDTPCEEKRAEAMQAAQEQMAAAQLAYKWQTPLWDASTAALSGGLEPAGAKWSPKWDFFPAQEGATLTNLTFSLPEPMPEGKRLVAMLRQIEGDDGMVMGSDDFPFRTRKTRGGIIAQASRSVPPGKYMLVAGLANDEGEFTPYYSGEALVAPTSTDRFSLSKVILAETLEQLSGGSGFGPFQLSGFEVVPRASDLVKKGEEVKFFYIVYGADPGPNGEVDLDVTYQIFLKRPQGWMKGGKPIVARNQSGTARAWELMIPDVYPATDYKVEIQVTDNRAGATAKRAVEFTVVD